MSASVTFPGERPGQARSGRGISVDLGRGNAGSVKQVPFVKQLGLIRTWNEFAEQADRDEILCSLRLLLFQTN
jgi:hypothetical protein